MIQIAKFGLSTPQALSNFAIITLANARVARSVPIAKLVWSRGRPGGQQASSIADTPVRPGLPATFGPVADGASCHQMRCVTVARPLRLRYERARCREPGGAGTQDDRP